MAVRNEIEDYLKELTNNPDVDTTANLFESGLLSSLDILDLISFIEETFNVCLSEDDMTMENFANLASIVKLIEELKLAK